MQEQGYVYILTNPSFREDWVKIGKSSLFTDILPKEDVNAFVPLPFEIYATIQSVNYHEIERLVHNMINRLTDLKVQSNTGFFNISPRKVFEVFCDIAEAIDDAEVKKWARRKSLLYSEDESFPITMPPTQEGCPTSLITEAKQPSRHCRFRFSLIGIKVGELVRFEPTGLMVRVASDNKVEYEGITYKLSPFVTKFMPLEQQNNCGAYQGSLYFSYQGRILEELRKEKEAKESLLSPNLKDDLA